MTQAPIEYIDTHAHLDDGQFDDAGAAIDAATKAGVRRIINIGYSPARWATTLALAARRPEIAYTLGLHPLSAGEYSAETMDALKREIARTAPVAIGEAGLDAYRDGPSLDLQRRAFADQIDLAVETGLPLVIHMRSTEAEITAMLSAASDRLRVVLHSFDGSMELARLVVSRNWHVGVGGLMTRAASVRQREVLQWLPLDRMVLETDSPYLVPAKSRDRRNTPANIPVIARYLAALKGEIVEDVARQTTEQAITAFPALRAGVRATERAS